MSQILPSPLDCCLPCPEASVVDIPGPQGPAGTNGTNGTNGVNAYTTVTNPFTMPAEAASVAVDVGATGWMTVGQKVFIGKAASAAKGTFQVAIVNTATNVTLTNVADTATSAYTENSAPGTVFPAGSAVSPSGLQGPAGTPGASGAPTTAKYILQTANGSLGSAQALDLLATGLMFSTFGTGVVTTKVVGIAAGNFAPVDAGGALTAGQVVQVVAGGLKSDTAANTRTLLGLGTISTQDANSVTISGGTIAGVAITGSTGSFTTLVVSTNWALAPSGLQTVAAANLIVYAPKVRVVGNAGPVTMTSTPTLSTGTVDGQECLIQGTDDTNTVTIQDNGTLAGSKLRLGANSRVLGKGDSVRLTWDTTAALWFETSYTNLV